MPNDTIPIIRFEVTQMRHALMVALTEHSLRMDADFQNAINRFCTPENIAHVIDEAVNATLHGVIKEEVTKFFRYGDGRSAVAKAVKEKLMKGETFTALDDA